MIRKLKNPFLHYLIFLMYVVVFQGCAKDINKDSPKVKIIKPYENQIFQVGDTIPIEAEISYSSVIKGISITLCDENYIHIMRSYGVYLKTNSSQKVNFIYPLDDDFLPSGNYYLEISVTGEFNSKNKYVKLIISGVPKENKGLGVVTKNGNNTNLILVDSAWQSNLQKSFIGTHIASCYLPFHNIFMEITEGTNYAPAIDFFTGKEKWKITKTNSTIGPYYSGTFTSGNKIDILYYDNRMETFSYDGKKKGIFSLTPDYFPDLSLNWNDLSIVYQKKKSNTETGILSVFYSATGAQIQSHAIDYKIVKIFPKNSKELVVFGNKNGEAVVKVYYLEDNTFWEPRTLDALPLSDAIQLNTETYLYLQNGHLIKFDLTHAWIFDLGLIQSNPNYSTMKFDKLNSVIYLSDYLKITAIYYPSLSYINSYNAPDSIMNFRIVYNN